MLNFVYYYPEHLQIELAKNFGDDDDTVIDKLRENMHDLISHRLDHPGKPPSEELPEKPFGLVEFKDEDLDDLPQEKKPKEWTVQKEAGLRTGKIRRGKYFLQKPKLFPNALENFKNFSQRLNFKISNFSVIF